MELKSINGRNELVSINSKIKAMAQRKAFTPKKKLKILIKN